MIVFYSGKAGGGDCRDDVPEQLNLPVMLTYWELVRPGQVGRRDPRIVRRFKRHRKHRRTK